MRKQPTLADISAADWQRHTDAGLGWVRKSIAATGSPGSSHSYSPIFGWAKAYPETTGYLAETLLVYARLQRDDTLRDLAFDCLDWLCTLQLSSGAFPGLLVGNTTPSVFNTGQILFGLASGIDAQGLHTATYRSALERAVTWLLEVLETDGSWQTAAFVPGFVPSYYTRAIQGVLRANTILQSPEIATKMVRALDFYAQRFRPNFAVSDWGFQLGRPAFTHTIAYTLEGFLESGWHLHKPQIVERASQAMQVLQSDYAQRGRLAGRYDAAWQGDYSFECPTGLAQFSCIAGRLGEITGDPVLQRFSTDLLTRVLTFQKFSHNKNVHGALPGSVPCWKNYLPLRYPNWGVKFLLDALAAYKKQMPGAHA